MGWPFFSPKRTPPGLPIDPSAVRPTKPTLGVGGRLGAASDFLAMAGNEGVAQLAGTAQRFLPDMFGSDGALEEMAMKRRQANDALIASRAERSGVPAGELGKIDPTDPRTRMATFAAGSPLNPDAGGVRGWHAAQAGRVADWNANPAVAPLQAPTPYINPMAQQTADPRLDPRRRGILFGRRR